MSLPQEVTKDWPKEILQTIKAPWVARKFSQINPVVKQDKMIPSWGKIPLSMVPTNRKFNNTKPLSKWDVFLHHRREHQSCKMQSRVHAAKHVERKSRNIKCELLHGCFIHPHTLLYSAIRRLRMDKLKSICSWWFCDPAAHHLSAH